MSRSLLDHYAEKNIAFLHGAGRRGTAHLVNKLELQGKERVLEIGFGTGATQVYLQSRFAQLELHGVEQSPKMWQKAQKRLRWCGLPTQHLHLLEVNQSYPFAEAYFEVVYLESVLGILDAEMRQQVFDQVVRVLRPGGTLALNETLWLEGVSREKIHRINEACRKNFGVAQAPDDLCTTSDWKGYFEQHGFKLNYCEPAGGYKEGLRRNLRDCLSLVYTAWGKFSQGLNRQHRLEADQVRQIQTQFFTGGQPCLESYVMVLTR